MAERIWTTMQKNAIDTRDRTLLVSAAAGSGKTAVLTERIIASLLDPNHPADISRMLIVTFTNAAAAELRARITAALQKALKENPGNRNLETQLLLLPSAEIRTIDAFCAKFLRRHAGEVCISPRFRIADEAESELIARSVLDELLNRCFEGVGFPDRPDAPSYCEEDFLLLADSLTGARDPKEKLTDILLALYRKCEGFPDRCRLLVRRAKEFENDAHKPYAESTCFRLIIKHLQDGFLYYADEMASAFEAFSATATPELTEFYGAPFSEENQLAQDAKEAFLSGDFLKISQVMNRETWSKTLRSRRSLELTEEAERMKALRTELHAYKNKKAAPLLTFHDKSFAEEAPQIARVLHQLAALMLAFEEAFSAEKQSRNLCEYSDLEHLTLQALMSEDGMPTSLALAEREGYDAVYIDEYQDVNLVQHLIFAMLSKPQNAFMVGDIKQSIYRFRGADPSIFASLRHEFLPFDRNSKQNRQTIFMQSNFRCDQPIIDFTNCIFDALLGAAGESIGYQESDRLFAGKALPPDACPQKVQLLLTSAEQPQQDSEADDESGDDGALSQKAVSAARAEAFVIADEIARLLHDGKKDNGTPILPGDIAILLRSVRTSFAEILTDELERRGIPCEATEDTDFFLNPDVLLILSLLNVINNPHRDIYLAGVLRSPLFAFTMDELVEMRKEGEADISLYECLKTYAAHHPESQKCRFFFDKLELYRERAEGMPVWRLLRFIYDDTAILALSDVSDAQKARSNLRLLYHYARNFESSSFRGLYSFLQYINRIIREGKRLPSEKNADIKPTSVRLMTIHASKGLEFPVCFLSNSGKVAKAQSERLLFSSELGAAFKLRTSDGLALLDNPLFRAISLENEKYEQEEMLRVLYVALTRASERLYITGDTKNPKKLLRATPDTKPSRFSVMSAKSFLALILQALPVAASAHTEFELYENGCFASLDSCDISKIAVSEECLSRTSPSLAPLQEEKENKEQADATAAPLTEQMLRARFDFVYPHKDALALPSKLSVSRLYPEALDEEDDTAKPLKTSEESQDDRPNRRTRPAFLNGGEEESGAARGTATHLFMQFCRFDLLQKNGVDAELQALVDLHFIAKEDAALVRKKEVERFLKSALFADLLTAQKIHRELRFHASLPASLFTANAEKKAALADETLFVQGVIDCVAVYADGSYDLIDYKTDRLPRDRAEAIALLRERHSLQLSYYSAACTQIFGRPPRALFIYSLPLGESIEVEMTIDGAPID